jgi:hypothetical protein
MFTFLAAFLTSVLICTVFYLIIVLKIEKNSTKFFSARLRREMEEMINEFNLTAERNITLLESRIAVMQKLLERTGDYGKVNIRHEEQAPSAHSIRKGADELRRVLAASGVSGGVDFRADGDVRVNDAPGITDAGLDPDIGRLYRESDDRIAFVASLYESGWTEGEISRQCGIPAGELDLMLRFGGR